MNPSPALATTAQASAEDQDHLAPFRGSWRRLQAAAEAARDEPSELTQDEIEARSAYFGREG